MGEREQAIILLLLATVISASFVMLGQRNRINELSQVYDNTRFDLNYLEAQYNHLYESYKELSNQTLEYRRLIIQLNQDLDKIERYEETWRTYREKYEEVLLENARLQGELIMQEYGDNITQPFVEPRKEVFRIGDTIAFNVESEMALYGSHFEVYDPNSTLIWEGDPLAEWVELYDYWVPPYYGQTAYMEPMSFTENYTLGNWTYIYWFGELKMGEGWFTLIEAAEDVIAIGVTDLSDEEGFVEIIPDLGGPITNVSLIAKEGIGSQAEPIFARDSSCSNPMWVPIITSIVVVAIFILRKTMRGDPSVQLLV
ncbi:MAG: hypothetical protein NWF07_08705 [Candidatus Bathyarchaeota archaeon]|nr:hypothetical protein [Candidatus Bathyarchaeota archaeon]